MLGTIMKPLFKHSVQSINNMRVLFHEHTFTVTLVSCLPQFFMLILFIFLAELAAAILAFLFREHVSFIINISQCRPKVSHQQVQLM